MRTLVAAVAFLATHFAAPVFAGNNNVFMFDCDLSISDGYVNRCHSGSVNTGVDCCAQGYTRCPDVIQCAVAQGLRVSSASPVFHDAFAIIYVLTKK